MGTMTSLEGKMKQYSMIVSMCAGLFIVGYFFTPYSAYFLGLFVGLSASFLNLWTTYQKTKVVGNVADKVNGRSFFAFVLAGFGFVTEL